jgi:amino acid permease
MSPDDELFTSDEVLGGFSAKRARLLLFQIESRTAYLMVQSRRAVDRYLTEEAAEQQDLMFFEALAEGRELPVRPTIRDLERYAPQWLSLVPPNRILQVALAHLLGQKYRFAQRDIPHIRQALGLDTEGVQLAFQRQYREPLDTIYTRRIGLLERIGWQWNRLGGWLEHLPPFWTAYALTFTEIVGASILALPIALAGVGPLAGVVVLVVMGVINMLTIAAMAEAVTRSGSIRYQGSYLGRLVQDYLGRPGSMLLSTMVVTICVIVLLAYYLGFSLTLAGATPIPAEVWAGLLFLLGVYFVRRKNLHATISSALVIGAINLGLILVLSVIALGHLRLENLSYVHVPFLGGRPFEPALLGLIFGVAFASYFGHFSVNSCARTVLERDPSGRSLLLGCITAQASAMVLYILWVVAVNGAIAPQALTGFSGTVLTPLAQLVGPAVIVLGTIYAILAMGMASIHFSLALFFTVREWIPGRSRHTLVLGRREGKLLFTPVLATYDIQQEKYEFPSSITLSFDP